MKPTKTQNILKEIEGYVNNDVTVIDALVFYAEKYDLEVELVGEIVRRSPVLRSRVQQDAETLNLMEKTARLPV
jgi:hypothetical protein